jgi:hypothetical protein
MVTFSPYLFSEVPVKTRALLPALCLIVVLAPLGVSEITEPDDVLQPVRVRLSICELPLSSYGSMSAATYIRSTTQGVLEGFDLLYQGRLGTTRDSMTGLAMGGRELRFLQKGWDRDTLAFYAWPKGGVPVALPRCKGGISTLFLSFGPARVKGFPLVTVHFIYPRKNIERWRASLRKIVYVLPMECLAGEVDLNGARRRIAVYDRTCNGRFNDVCRTSNREGDWILFDRNGDNRFGFRSRPTEVIPMTSVLRLAGSWWKVRVEGKMGSRELVLTPAGVETFRLRLTGVPGSVKVRGWSYGSGLFEETLDAQGSIRLPRNRYRVYNYIASSGEFRFSATMRRRGVAAPPADGEVACLDVGPPFMGKITRYDRRGNTGFNFQLLDRAGGSVTLYRKDKRVQPVFVIRNADDEEVLRKTCRFG